MWILSNDSTGNSRLAWGRANLSELEFDVAYKLGLTHWMADSMYRMETTHLEASPIADEISVFHSRWTLRRWWHQFWAWIRPTRCRGRESGPSTGKR